MTLQLKRPICFFDLETTGTSISKDRIVEIAILKVFQNGDKETKSWLVNPEMPIPALATEIHGITNEKVSNAPTFKEISKLIFNYIQKSDLAGYNSDRFDIPILAEEMMRAGIDNFDKNEFLTIDVQTIFHKMEQRTLSAAFKFYCGKEHINSHSAMADTEATYEVLLAQLERYRELKNDVGFLNDFTKRQNSVDFAGFIYYDEKNKECISFGKHKDKTLEQIIKEDPNYVQWILNAEFPLYTKKKIKEIHLKILKKNR